MWNMWSSVYWFYSPPIFLQGPIEEQQFQVALQVRNFARDVGGVQCAFNLCLVAARMHNNNADAAVVSMVLLSIVGAFGPSLLMGLFVSAPLQSMILEDAESAQVQLEAEKARIEGELEVSFMASFLVWFMLGWFR